jgi:hypothetical protein
MAYKAEQAVDLDTGVIVAITTHGGATGDSESVQETLRAAEFAVAEQIADSAVHHKSRNAQRPGRLEKEDRFGFIASSRRSGHYLRLFPGLQTFTDQIFPFRQSAAEFAQIAPLPKIEVLTRAPRSVTA